MTAHATHIERDEQGRAARLIFGPLPASEAQEMNDAPGAVHLLCDAPAGQSVPLQRDPERRVCGRVGCGKPLTGKQERWCSETCRWKAWDAAHPRLPGRTRQAVLPGASRVERRFAEWIETPAGRYVEAEVLRLAREDLADGYRRGEINLYLALVRRASRGLTKDRQGYACNNSFRSLLARRLMAGHLELGGFFQTRDLRGVA